MGLNRKELFELAIMLACLATYVAFVFGGVAAFAMFGWNFLVPERQVDFGRALVAVILITTVMMPTIIAVRFKSA
jgi:hypothetical protein